MLSSSSTENRPDTPTTYPKKNKKRKLATIAGNWKQKMNKMLRNTGQAYTNRRQKIIEERKIKPPCGERCRLQCQSKLTHDERALLFKEYWALGAAKRQWEYILKCMSIILPKYRYVRDGAKPRQNNNAFHFKLPGKTVRVCKIFFVNTLGISNSQISTALNKRSNYTNSFPIEDNRGKHNKHPRKEETIRNGIRAYIETAPKTKSKSSKVYIVGCSSIAQLHNKYVAFQQEKKLCYANYSFFYRMFNKEYGHFCFRAPKKSYE